MKYVWLLAVIVACSGPSEAADSGDRVTIFTHCGFYETVFGGEVWTPDSIARGAFPEGTDSMATKGTMTRVDGRAKFVADSGLEVWFAPAPPDLPAPPPCD